MPNLLFPAGQLMAEVIYIRVFAKKPSHFWSIERDYFKKEPTAMPPPPCPQASIPQAWK